MTKSTATVALVVAMVVLIVVVDVAVFRTTPWPRLAANVGLGDCCTIW